MNAEVNQNKYRDTTATVVGGNGAIGRKIATGLRDIGVGQVIVCEKGDPFTELVTQSKVLFFAVDATLTSDMLQTAQGLGLLPPNIDVLDGTSVKTPLFPLYRYLDHQGLSVCSTHLGAVPTQPWRGVKVWLCTVGPNSAAAKELALDLYISRKTSIRVIDIKEHPNIEEGQWATHDIMQLFASFLRLAGIPLSKFERFATLNGDLAALVLGRSLGQGTVVPSEILFTQPRKRKLMEIMHDALEELEEASTDREKLQALMATNISYHDNPPGSVRRMFGRGGVVGARLANLRMYSLSCRIIDDSPGKLMRLLAPFAEVDANLTAIDSMPGAPTPADGQAGVDPDQIVDFDFGVDPNTINPQTEQRIKDSLVAMGCKISYNEF